MLDKELKNFKENVNEWIKEIKEDTGQLEELKRSLIEAHNNIQHDYELIYELKEEVEKIKLELNYIKLLLIKAFKKNKLEVVKWK